MPPLRGRQLAALRACGVTGGARLGAYPSAMPILRRLGLVRERKTPRNPGWVLTDAGRKMLDAVDRQKP